MVIPSASEAPAPATADTLILVASFFASRKMILPRLGNMEQNAMDFPGLGTHPLRSALDNRETGHTGSDDYTLQYNMGLRKGQKK